MKLVLLFLLLAGFGALVYAGKTGKVTKKLKLIVFLVVCAFMFAILGLIIPEAEKYFDYIWKFCILADAIILLFSMFVKFFGNPKDMFKNNK